MAPNPARREAEEPLAATVARGSQDASPVEERHARFLAALEAMARRRRAMLRFTAAAQAPTRDKEAPR